MPSMIAPIISRSCRDERAPLPRPEEERQVKARQEVTMPKLSAERAVGRAVLSNPLIAEAFSGFAETERRSRPNAARYVFIRGLEALGWMRFENHWTVGPRLEAFRSRKSGAGLSGDAHTSPGSTVELGNVVPFRPPAAPLRRTSARGPAAPLPRPPAG
jgi:hypothetical protein